MELDSNVSVCGLGGDGTNSTVEVYEGRDVTLTFIIEAYPPIRSQHWTTPAHSHNNTVYRVSYTANGYRLAC